MRFRLIKNKHINDLRICELFKGKQEKERELQIKLAQIMINSSDPEELKNKIVREIAEELNASRCFFIEYDSTTNNFKKITNSYNTKRDSVSILGHDVEHSIPNLATKLKYMKSIVFEDTQAYISENNLNGLNEDNYFKKFGVKASMAVRLAFGELFLGILVVHYEEKKPFLQDIDLTFLKNIAEHISIALHLSTLYVDEKEEKEKERLLRSIISIMSADYDMDKITQKIFELLAKIYNAQDVFINVEVGKFKKDFYYNSKPQSDLIEKNEKNNQIDLSIYELSNFDSIKNKVHYVADTHNFIIQNNLENSEIEQYFAMNNVKSLILFPIRYENSTLGFLIIHFNMTNLFKKDDLALMKTVTEQLAIAIKQAHDYELQKETAERESLLRKITETIRSSLNIEDTLDYICKESTKLFNLQRATIVSYPDLEDLSSFIVRKEYKVDPSVKGLSFVENISKFSEYWLTTFKKGYKTVAIDNINDLDAQEEVKNAYNLIGVKSIIAIPIQQKKALWGCIVLSEYNKYRHWSEDEINLLSAIADQVYIAINQAELYDSLKQTTTNLNAILNNIPYWAWLKDRENRYILANEKYAQDKNLTVETFIGKTDFDLFPPELAEEYTKDDQEVMASGHLKMIEDEETNINGQKRFLETYKQPYFGRKGEIIGTIGIAKDITEKKESELELLRRQEKIIKANEREGLLRKIFEAMRVTLNLDVIKNTIVKEVGKALNADRCLILTYDSKQDYFFIDEHSEYLSPAEDKSMINFDTKSQSVKRFMEAFKRNEEIASFDMPGYIVENNLQGAPEDVFVSEYKIKSSYNIALNYADKLLGYLVIHYSKDYKTMDENELVFIRNIAAQAGITIHQAELYQTIQMQAETERFNRKILEILRNSLDKNTIKHLFVVNIGKYFKADRVFFVDYDFKRNVYLPIDSYSEYLAGPEEKSFVGLDWSDSSLKEYIRPLLEKREMKISCWDDYIQANQNDEGFVSRFKDAGVKSSYNFPVIHEGKIMGYFCIEFTKDMCVELNDEEINRIRSMCTQAAVALYNSDLFAQARAIANSKNILISKVDDSAIKLLNEVEILSEEMSDVDVKCSKHQLRQNQIDEILKNLKYFITNILEADKEAKDES